VTATIRLARPEDEAGLQRLARECPMAGGLTIRTEREPRFLALNELQGTPSHVVVAEDAGRIVGSAAAAIRDVYVSGVPTRAAYLGDLRIAADARGGTLLWRLHQLVADLIRDAGTDLAYTTIIDGNVAAGALRGERRGMPRYRPLGRIRVCAISDARRTTATPGIAVDRARPDDRAAIASLLDAFAARHEFAPVWTTARLAAALSSTPGLGIECFFVAREGGHVVGTLAAWDQDALQRRRILRYGGRASAYRAIQALRARAGHRPALPAPGGLLRELHVTHVAVEGDRAEVFEALLHAAWDAFAEGYHFLTFGLAEGHPLLRALRSFHHGAFHTVLHAVSWDGSRWTAHAFRGPLFHEISHL